MRLHQASRFLAICDRGGRVFSENFIQGRDEPARIAVLIVAARASAAGSPAIAVVVEPIAVSKKQIVAKFVGERIAGALLTCRLYQNYKGSGILPGEVSRCEVPRRAAEIVAPLARAHFVALHKELGIWGW